LWPSESSSPTTLVSLSLSFSSSLRDLLASAYQKHFLIYAHLTPTALSIFPGLITIPNLDYLLVLVTI
jgi:hypothetical protein